MLPLTVARQLEAGVQDYLRTTYPVTTAGFREREGDDTFLTRFLRVEGALSKGPWLEVKLPFRRAGSGLLPFRHLEIPFDPYQHQVRAFERLTGRTAIHVDEPPNPRSTLVATGTGSGKTECFLYPILDACLEDRRPGIKAIIIYPMNALAKDQARRFADACSRLSTKLSVGLYTGDGGEPTREMSPEMVITDRNTLRQAPPDVLLTNYKMLDFLMIRPADKELWRHNRPGLLKYVVVDELHTFDGAQGTDLACLLRRLRRRLRCGPELVYVGTSATLGGQVIPEATTGDSLTDAETTAHAAPTAGPDPALLDYARLVFDTPMAPDAVVLEDRLSLTEYLDGTAQDQPVIVRWPSDSLDMLRLRDQPGAYLSQAARAWLGVSLPFDDADPARCLSAAVELGRLLPRLTALQELLRHAQEGVIDLARLRDAWRQRLRLDSLADAQMLIDSLAALVSAARIPKAGSAPAGPWLERDLEPFLTVRVQLWLRELRRMVAPVGPSPSLVHADDLQDTASPLHLPVLHCRECHAAAWGAVWRRGERQVEGGLQEFYQAWFRHHPDVRFIYPVGADAAIPDAGATLSRESGEAGRAFGASRTPALRLCPACRGVGRPNQAGEAGADACDRCGAGRISVHIPDVVKETTRRSGATVSEVPPDCPTCGARESVSIVGSRSTSLASVCIQDLFGSAYNGDFKLIAFSDSVQDAAHRAGFFGARTYRQVIRSALARLVRENPDGLPLSLLVDEFPLSCRRHSNGDADFAGNFVAPDMEWLKSYKALVDGVTPDAVRDLADLVSKRLRFEVLLEFGLRSRIGRTLERIGVAGVSPDDSRFEETCRRLALRLRQELGTLREVGGDEVRDFTRGLLTYWRQRGALHDPVLDIYAASGGNSFLLHDRNIFLPRYGTRVPPPPFISMRHVHDAFETVIGRSRWYGDWFNKCLAVQNPLASAEVEHAYGITVKELLRSGWLVERTTNGAPVWSLDPRHWLVFEHSWDLACCACAHRLPVASRDDAFDLPCLRPGCVGRYGRPHSPERNSLFRMAPRRLVPREHTALLDDHKRHEIETSFIAGKHSWDVNLLSATPTLEMGIDIGALSTVLLCSVPPAQTNYVQRIGRAGRRDGNALALTMAGGRPHDLYFYASPLEMIAGRVAPPGVFLKAVSVLERQLIAYGFDRWAASGVSVTAIPGQLGEVLNTVESRALANFPFTLLDFIDLHGQDLITEFIELFEGLDADSRDSLSRFVLGGRSEGSLGWRVLNRIEEISKVRRSHKERAESLKKRIKELEKQPKDEARDAMLGACRDEREASLELIREINTLSTLNFFTDEGLLPNYAFPEEGVTLRAVIQRRSKESEGESRRRVETLSLTFQRPAQAALGELVPDTHFYASEHKLHIDRIDLRTTEPRRWRLCPECHYSENVDQSGDPHSVCPRCGCALWADAGQRRTLLRLKQVYARADARKDRIGDESEERSVGFFKRQLLVDIASSEVRGGFRLDSAELPFGFEYVKKALLREVNFGEGGDSANTFKVAGRNEPRRGFAVCRHCGTVRRTRIEKGRFAHALDCPLVRTPHGEEPAETWLDSLYLYRELESEAIRILLPLADVAESDVGRRSFAAAIALGLRRYFKGGVDHLELVEMNEPNTHGEGASGRRQYLVLYDRIPGGTGYLKELMQSPENLFDVFAHALDVVSRCPCADDPARDGCYRCLLAYRDSRNMASISRRTAQRLLQQIVDLRDRLVPIESLKTVSISQLFGSPLEAKFVAALSRLSTLLVSKQTVGGKAAYAISPPIGREGALWELEPQVKLGPSDGVALTTIPDFILRPARAAERSLYGEWAIYLDGFGPHHQQQSGDTRKREAVRASGRPVWTLTYDDVPEPGQEPNEAVVELVSSGQDRGRLALYDKLAEKYDWPTVSALHEFVRVGPFRQLALLMGDPVGTRRLLDALPLASAIGWFERGAKVAGLWADPATGIAAQLPPATKELLSASDEPVGFGGFATTNLGGAVVARVMGVLPAGALLSKARLCSEAGIHLWLDDGQATHSPEFTRVWRGFWNATNVYQFAPRFSALTAGALLESSHGDLAASLPAAHPFELPAGWEELETSILPKQDIATLWRSGIEAPDVGVDLTVGNRVIGTVELLWRGAGVAVLAGDELDEAPASLVVVRSGEDGYVERVVALVRAGNMQGGAMPTEPDGSRSDGR